MLAISCDKRPTAPGPVRETGGAPQPVVQRIELTGPGTVAPGETVRFVLTEFRSDGTTRDTTEGAGWGSSDQAILSIDNNGVATGLAAGEVSVWTRAALQSRSMQVIVTPAGTFRLRGVVMEAGVPNPVSNAEVRLRGPGGETQQTRALSDGYFTFFGVASGSQLTVTHDGYTEHMEQLQLTSHALVRVFLSLAGERANVAGTYALTITSGPCDAGGDTWTDEWRSRTYTAEVRQQGIDVAVTLSDAEFASHLGRKLNSFTGKVKGTRFSFELFGLESYDYSYGRGMPDLAESVGDGTFLVTSGAADVAVTGTGMAGTLAGTMQRLKAVPRGGTLSFCTGRHTVRFAR